MSWIGTIFFSALSGAVVLYASGGLSREFWWRRRHVGFGRCLYCGEKTSLLWGNLRHVHGPKYIEYPGNREHSDGT